VQSNVLAKKQFHMSIIVLCFVALNYCQNAYFQSCNISCGNSHTLLPCTICEASKNLQTFYWDDDGWDIIDLWMQGNGVEIFVNYQNTSALEHRATAGAIAALVSDAYPWERLVVERWDGYDDLLWWALAYIRLYEQTEAPTFLDSATIIFDYVYDESWDTTQCGGGFYWTRKNFQGSYKNAITNELGIVAASKLAVVAGDASSRARYASIADVALAWFLNSGMLGNNGLICDGLKILHSGVCVPNGETPWTYNQGVILLALALAAQRHNNATYVRTSERILDGVVRHLTDSKGVLREAFIDLNTDVTTRDDLIFKGIFVRYVAYAFRSLSVTYQQKMRKV
jgi:predicted alpha-1,6-mannanase (GH76 family)